MNPDDFCIIANNCWGAEVYKRYNFPFNTPIIGLYFYPEDYLNFIADLRNNLSTEVTFTKESRNIKDQKHPVGLVNGIEIHFLHYETEQEAFEKWTKRCKRVLADEKKLFFKFDDRDGATEDHIHRFHSMGLTNSVSFTKTAFKEYPTNFQIPMEKKEECVMDGYKQFYVVEELFDLNGWLHGHGVTSTFKQKLNLKKRRLKLRLS